VKSRLNDMRHAAGAVVDDKKRMAGEQERADTSSTSSLKEYPA